MERETYLLEYIHHQLVTNEAVGLKAWLAWIAECRATWHFDLCKWLIRAIRVEKLSPLALGLAKNDKGLVYAQQGHMIIFSDVGDEDSAGIAREAADELEDG